MKSNTRSKHLIINEVENAIDYLEAAATFIQREDTMKWKWVVIAIHNALYSFCISCLTGTNYENVLTSERNPDKGVKIWYGGEAGGYISSIKKRHQSPGYIIQWQHIDEEPNWINQEGTRGQGKATLLGFWTALARVQDEKHYMGRMIHTKALKLSDEEWKSIEWLTLAVRNALMHFVPRHLGISIQSMKISVSHVIRAIEFLALESNAVVYHKDRTDKERVRKAIKTIRDGLDIV